MGFTNEKENYESKSKYLKNYFESNKIEHKVYHYELNDTPQYIGTNSVIEFILLQDSKEKLQMIELEIRDIERNKRDIHPYLESIGYQMVGMGYK